MKNPKLAALTQGLDVMNHDFDQQLDKAIARLPEVRAAGNQAFRTINGHMDDKLAELGEAVQFVKDLEEVAAKGNGHPTERATETGSQQQSDEQHDAKPEVTAEPVVPFAKTA